MQTMLQCLAAADWLRDGCMCCCSWQPVQALYSSQGRGLLRDTLHSHNNGGAWRTPWPIACLVAAARLLHSRELMQRLACLDIMTSRGGPGRHMRSGLSFALLFPNALNALPRQLH